jgi:hypothetical protein
VYLSIWSACNCSKLCNLGVVVWNVGHGGSVEGGVAEEVRS